MKVLVLWSSPNTDGLTASAKDRVMEGLAAAGIETEEIQLNAQDLHHCAACGNGFGTCRSEGTCVQQDDFAAIYGKLTEADGIVLVTAVYWHDVTECMKAFLDRLRRCEANHNHFLKEKPCLLAACAGGSGNGAVECLRAMEKYAAHLGLVPCDRLPVIRFNKAYMLPALAEAGQAFGKKLSGEA